MSEVTFKDYIDTLVSNKNYEELFVILSYCDYQKLDEHLLKIMATASYRLKKYNTCIELCNHWIELGYPEDYFIFEIFAESLFQKNNLQDSLTMYKKAVALKPSLKLASYRILTLEYRLNGNLNNALMLNIEKNANQNNNINHLRSIAYIQIGQKEYEKAYQNLEKIIELSKNIYYPDILSVCYVIKQILLKVSGSQKIKLNNSLNSYEKKLEENVFHYKHESNNSSTLFITLAPASGFLFQKYEYEADKLFLVDGTGTYFVLSYDKIIKFISEIIAKHNYKKISIAGSSKGGTGVILLLNKLQYLFPDLIIKAVSFSPQIKLWPFNANLTIPSYRVLSEYISSNPILNNAFEKGVKDIAFDILPNSKLTVFYGNNFKMDEIEASYIMSNSKNLEIIELKYSGHGTSIPLTIPENKTVEELRSRYANLPIDPDFAELGGDKLVDIVDEIFEIYSDPNMRLHKFLC